LVQTPLDQNARGCDLVLKNKMNNFWYKHRWIKMHVGVI